MEQTFSRRGFLKGAAAAALAVSAMGLTGCSTDAGAEPSTAVILGDYKVDLDLKRSVLGKNGDGSATGIPLNPTGGSFKLRVNGSEELDINSDTMAILNKNSKLNALDTRTLNRGQYAKGHLCGKGSGVSKFNYVQVLFYPNPQDAKTYLCCKIAAKEASLMLGI